MPLFILLLECSEVAKETFLSLLGERHVEAGEQSVGAGEEQGLGQRIKY